MKKALVLALVLMTFVGLPLFAAGTPAGTQIKNQATAQYKDANGNVQSSTSNEVITIVQQISGVTVTPNGSTSAPIVQTATAGTRVYFPYTLTNTGNGPDTFNVVTALSPITFTPDNVKIYLDANGDGVVDAGDNEITNTGTVAADGVVHLIVAYDVPTGATSAQSALVNLTATSTHDNTKVDNDNWNKTTVVADAVMTIAKSATVEGGTVAYPGSKIDYVISGSNTGSKATTSLAFTKIDTSGDGTADSASGLLVEDPIPAGIIAAGTNGPSVTYVAPTGATILYYYGGGDIWSTATTLSGKGSITKIGVYIPGSLDAGQGYRVEWTGTVASDAAVGMLTNTAVLHWADVGGSDKATSSNTTQTMINATFGVQIGPQGNPGGTGAGDVTQKDNQKAGATIVFQNTVKNTGTDSDILNISTTWSAHQISGASVSLFMADGLTPLGDANADGVPDTGALAKGASIDIVVKVAIPGNTASDALAHDVTVTAKSTKDGTKFDTTIDRINEIVAGSTNLSNNTGSGDTAYGLSENPGSTVTFPLIITNNNGYAETYALDQNTALKPGWSVVFYPDSDGDGKADPGSNPISSTSAISSLGTYKFVAVVTIAANQVPITGDPNASGTGQGLEFQATGSLSGQVDTQHDWVNVDSVYTFTFEPDNSGISTPGGTVIYQHKIKNTGNIAQTFTVGLDSTPKTGWTYTFSSDGTTYSNSLSGITVAVDAEMTIYVKVFVPSSEAVGAQDTGVAKATNNAGTPVSLSRQDTTTVVGGNLKLSKTVTSVNAADTLTLDQPGDELTYTVAYQNLASKPLTEVFIYDSVPLYTGFKVGSASGATTIEYSKDNGATWTYAPSSTGGGAPSGYDYAVTNIRWTIGTVNGGVSGSVSFTVRIK